MQQTATVGLIAPTHTLTFAEFFSEHRLLVSEKHEIPLKKVGALNEVLVSTLVDRLLVSRPLVLLTKNFLSLWSSIILTMKRNFHM